MYGIGCKVAPTACCIGLTSLTTTIPALLFADSGDSESADVVVCEADAKTARICSSEILSNIVLECIDPETEHSYYVKFEDLHNPAHWPVGQFDSHQGIFSCPDGDNLVAVVVKSGRESSDGPEFSELLPERSAFRTPPACSPVADDCAWIVGGTADSEEEAE